MGSSGKDKNSDFKNIFKKVHKAKLVGYDVVHCRHTHVTQRIKNMLKRCSVIIFLILTAF